jgi:hypothetical protein
MSGVVEELLPLLPEVGTAEAFYSHVQGVSLTVAIESLEQAEVRYKKELLQDRVKTAALRKKALQDFLRARVHQISYLR